MHCFPPTFAQSAWDVAFKDVYQDSYKAEFNRTCTASRLEGIRCPNGEIEDGQVRMIRKRNMRRG
eukprot:449872-Pyramimonas_sp.AAC.1